MGNARCREPARLTRRSIACPSGLKRGGAHLRSRCYNRKLWIAGLFEVVPYPVRLDGTKELVAIPIWASDLSSLPPRSGRGGTTTLRPGGGKLTVTFIP